MGGGSERGIERDRDTHAHVARDTVTPRSRLLASRVFALERKAKRLEEGPRSAGIAAVNGAASFGQDDEMVEEIEDLTPRLVEHSHHGAARSARKLEHSRADNKKKKRSLRAHTTRYFILEFLPRSRSRICMHTSRQICTRSLMSSTIHENSTFAVTARLNTTHTRAHSTTGHCTISTTHTHAYSHYNTYAYILVPASEFRPHRSCVKHRGHLYKTSGDTVDGREKKIERRGGGEGKRRQERKPSIRREGKRRQEEAKHTK